jgi:hypothetical protein
MRNESGLKPLPQLALCFALTLAACGPSLATRYAAGNQALSTGDGPMYFVVIAPMLQQTLNRCVPPGLAGASPMLLVVADVDASGRALNADVEPDSPGSDCVRDALREATLPRPPLAPGAATFPIGLRIDTE